MVDVGELVERASLVGWRWECKWECACVTGGFGCTGRAWYISHMRIAVHSDVRAYLHGLSIASAAPS